MNTTTAVAERALTPVAEMRLQLDNMEGQFKAALPAHIPAERFARVLMTALQNNPGLLKCDRRSFWNAAMKSAQDGLLPDGREGAIVPYGDQAQWMPMIAGLRKKVRNSGEIATWDAQVVHEKDAFKFQLGDDPFIQHEPSLDADPGKVIAAYSIAVLKSGEKSREVMSVAQIEKVRGRSKAKNNGPWITDYAEMCRKTVARRHSKMLPMSTDLDDLIRRDDDLYDLEGARAEAAEKSGGRPQTLAGKLDVLAQMPGAAATTTETDAAASSGGEASSGTAQSGDASPATDPASPQPTTQPSPAEASQGASDPSQSVPTVATAEAPEASVPKNAAEYVTYATAWIGEVPKTISPDDAKARWKGELKLRNACGVDEETRDPLKAALDKALAAASQKAA